MPAAPTVMLGCSVAPLAGCANARTAVPSATRPVPLWWFARRRPVPAGRYALAAPPAAFAAVDRSVFAPVRRSLVPIRSGAA